MIHDTHQQRTEEQQSRNIRTKGEEKKEEEKEKRKRKRKRKKQKEEKNERGQMQFITCQSMMAQNEGRKEAMNE